MYVSIGKNKSIDTRDIIGIFDLDITSQSHITRKFLSTSEKTGMVENQAEDLPKTFILTKNKKVYLSQIATATLNKRIEEVK